MSSGLEIFSGMGVLAATAFFIVAVWSIVWKGFALWISAKEEKKWWFIPILIFNTAGILEIIYIFFFSETGKNCVGEFKKRRAHKKAHKKSKHIASKKVEDDIVGNN